MIEVRGLTKQYGSLPAVKDVSFSVGKDQVLGFLGPNGAGKTTIMKALTGYHFPSKGSVLVDGLSVEEFPREVKQRIGYLPENVPLYGELTPEEYLRFMAESRMIPPESRNKYIARAVESCGLSGVRFQRIDTLSKGYRQRLGLAQAILHDPPILILDEPTTGLDPNQIIEIRKLIKKLGERKTVILSTHILQEVEAVCSRVLILNEGSIAAQGTPGEIARSMKGRDTWNLVLKGAGKKEIISRVSLLGNAVDVLSSENLGGGTVSLSIAGDGPGNTQIDGEMIFDWAVAGHIKILSMNKKTMSIEDIFVKLTNEDGAQE